jgi:CheY-like chemotaxis protein
MQTQISHHYQFQTQEELPSHLIAAIGKGECGYWQHQFDRLAAQAKPLHWNVGTANGRLLFSGGNLWSSKSLLSILSRYVPHTRSEQAQAVVNKLWESSKTASAQETWQVLVSQKIVTPEQLETAFRLKVLYDFDTYASIGGGQATFIPEPCFGENFPIVGLDIKTIVEEFYKRQAIWTKIAPYVPSMNLVPTIDREGLSKNPLSPAHLKKIEEIIQPGRMLRDIAEGMGKDHLDVAQMFAQLAMKKIVNLESPSSGESSTVMIVDDSPLILKQFQRLVTMMGYPVVICQNPATAISTIWKIDPAAIFIDINMPGISGFDLVKQIRQKPQLKDIPIVILTGEQKNSNKWRAKWSNCEFLTKPLLAKEVNEFQIEVQKLLERFVKPPTDPLDRN